MHEPGNTAEEAADPLECLPSVLGWTGRQPAHFFAGVLRVESVGRQAGMATQNLVNLLKGEKALAQVNDVVPPTAIL